MGDGLLLWRSREVGGLDWLGDGWSAVGDAWDLLAGLSDQALGLLRVLSNIYASSLSGTSGVVRSKILDLGGLLVDKVAGVGEVCVNDLLVLEVDKGREVDAGGEDQGKTPKWEPLDEVVGDEGSEESL